MQIIVIGRKGLAISGLETHGTLVNSEDPDEMPQNEVFHQGCTVC